MRRTVCSITALAALALGLSPLSAQQQDEPVVFKSDVSLVRVDVQVLSSTGQIISGLRREEFELRDGGQVRDIVNFGRENLPLDLVLLLDVSGSMRPHVEQMAQASHEALRVLGNEDRVAIVVFDRSTRISMPFKSNHDEIVRGFEQLLNRESFNGGTDITRAMFDSIRFLKRNARPAARRAIVILTDDRTEFNRDDVGVGRELEDANIVMSALLVPDAMGGMQQRYPTSSRRGGGGGGWPGAGGGLGGIIFGGGGWPGTGGRRIPQGGGNGPVIMGNGRLKSAGTAEIARASGGDSVMVDNASALEDTLERIRTSYALYFNAPEGVRQGEKRNISIALHSTATRRYPNAELRYRPSYVVSEGSTTSGQVPVDDTPTITRRNPGASAPASNGGVFDDEQDSSNSSNTGTLKSRRRVAVDEPGSSGGGFRKVDTVPTTEKEKAAEPNPAPVAAPTPAASATTDEPRQGGFKRVKPNDKPEEKP